MILELVRTTQWVTFLGVFKVVDPQAQALEFEFPESAQNLDYGCFRPNQKCKHIA